MRVGQHEEETNSSTGTGTRKHAGHEHECIRRASTVSIRSNNHHVFKRARRTQQDTHRMLAESSEAEELSSEHKASDQPAIWRRSLAKTEQGAMKLTAGC